MPKYDNNNRWGAYYPYNPLIALTHSVRTNGFAGTGAPNIAAMPAFSTGPVFTTSNNQTKLDKGIGILTTATSKYCSITGFLGDAPNTTAGDLRLVSGQAFGAITWVSLTDQTLRTATKSLVTISSKQQNTNMVWDGTTTVHNNWGGAPTLMQPLTLTLRLRSSATSICVYPLDATGLQGNCTTYTPVGGYFTITLNQTSNPTLWFGIQANFPATSASAKTTLNIADGLQLSPNPAAETVSLDFVLDEASNTTVTILDVAGKTVRSLDLGRLEAGEQTTRLDVSDLPSGVYVCRLNAGTHTWMETLVKS